MPARKRNKQKAVANPENLVAAPREVLRDLLPGLKEQLQAHEREHGSGASGAFEKLVDVGCSPEWLMVALSTLRLAFEVEGEIHGDSARMDSRRVRSLLERTVWIAREWRREFQSSLGRAILRSAAGREPQPAEAEYLRIPERLLNLAAELKDIHRGSSRQRRPLYDDRLADLTEYVRLATRDYHDPQVSTLVWFATGREYTANALSVWRNQHPGAVARARRRLLEN